MARKALASIVAVTAVLCAACSDDSRPTISEWRPAWEATRDLIPDAATIEEQGSDACSPFLGLVRERRAELTPAPTKTVDDAFADWAEEAEALGLDCKEGTDDLDERLAEVDRLGDRVDRVLGG